MKSWKSDWDAPDAYMCDDDDIDESAGLRRDPRRAYRVVDAFEDELAHYTGAPYAVAVNSCTNAIFLALTWEAKRDPLLLQQPLLMPRRTYIGVLQAARNAGYTPYWHELGEWQITTGQYQMKPSMVIDSARHVATGMFDDYAALFGHLICLSFHVAKQLPLGRGGAILTDDVRAAEWFRAARMDGRPPGARIDESVFPGWHMPMPPDVAARGLDILSRWNDAGYTPPPLLPTDYPDLSLL